MQDPQEQNFMPVAVAVEEDEEAALHLIPSTKENYLKILGDFLENLKANPVEFNEGAGLSKLELGFALGSVFITVEAMIAQALIAGLLIVKWSKQRNVDNPDALLTEFFVEFTGALLGKAFIVGFYNLEPFSQMAKTNFKELLERKNWTLGSFILTLSNKAHATIMGGVFAGLAVMSFLRAAEFFNEPDINKPGLAAACENLWVQGLVGVLPAVLANVPSFSGWGKALGLNKLAFMNLQAMFSDHFTTYERQRYVELYFQAPVEAVGLFLRYLFNEGKFEELKRFVKPLLKDSVNGLPKLPSADDFDLEEVVKAAQLPVIKDYVGDSQRPIIRRLRPNVYLKPPQSYLARWVRPLAQDSFIGAVIAGLSNFAPIAPMAINALIQFFNFIPGLFVEDFKLPKPLAIFMAVASMAGMAGMSVTIMRSNAEKLVNFISGRNKSLNFVPPAVKKGFWVLATILCAIGAASNGFQSDEFVMQALVLVIFALVAPFCLETPGFVDVSIEYRLKFQLRNRANAQFADAVKKTLNEFRDYMGETYLQAHPPTELFPPQYVWSRATLFSPSAVGKSEVGINSGEGASDVLIKGRDEPVKSSLRHFCCTVV